MKSCLLIDIDCYPVIFINCTFINDWFRAMINRIPGTKNCNCRMGRPRPGRSIWKSARDAQGTVDGRQRKGLMLCGFQAIDFHVFSRVCCLCNLVAFRFSRRNATRLYGHNLTSRDMGWYQGDWRRWIIIDLNVWSLVCRIVILVVDFW